ncbi:MAG TPA: NCS2 family permease [Kiritimatiellia bacterium]|nr:NCS2 family permease [Kiritimatiellia bacterium]HPS06580.1 NCS2 family permease [Kiritimatiellia bacterium]
MNWIESYFRLSENGTTARVEMLAGITTFLTMAYIIFVQPAVLSGQMFGLQTGMDLGALTVATCLSAAIATAIMGLYARYPIALAPGMGENFFFVFTVVGAAASAGFPDPWRVALGVVFISGLLFFLLYALGIREKIFDALSPSLKNGIAAGIGIFIAFIGLQNAGVIVKAPGTLVTLNTRFASPDMMLFGAGLLLTLTLLARRVRGAILWGILAVTAVAVLARWALPHVPALAGITAVAESKLMTQFSPSAAVVSLPPSLAPTFCKMDLLHALKPVMWPFILIILFMDVFDTVGTLVGVGEQAGFIKDNKLPGAKRAMLADQTGTLVGAVLGTSTVTSFIESTAGVEAGGRTGLTALTTAACFLVAPFFAPLIVTVGSYTPITAPALVVVGAMMVRNVHKIDWSDFSELAPAFLVMIGIPLCYSISDGLALGFIAYPLIKLFSGRGREVAPAMYVIAVALIGYFAIRATL